MPERTIEGTVLRGPAMEPIEGRVVLEDGTITAVEETGSEDPPDGDASDAIVLPAFVNAHTHVGDSVVKEAGRGLTLEELVAPPDGLKHRELDAASREELVAGMRRTFAFMERAGTGAFVDFRENGVAGVEAIHDALAGFELDGVVLGRESIDAMHESDGFGASGANDATFDNEREATREAGKLFGIHAGEVDASDIQPTLDLDPDFLVHMVHASEAHLEAVEDREIPVAVCPRSNLTTGVGLPPMDALAERTTLALGTDNVFLNSPSMFREMAVAAKCSDLDAQTVLRMATVNGAELAGLECGVIEEGRPARLLVLDGDSDNLAGSMDPLRAVVRRAGVDDVREVVLPEGE